MMTVASMAGRSLASFVDDQEWRQTAPSAALLMVISSLAFQILALPPLATFCWGMVGFSTGFLAKKFITPYDISEYLTRRALTFNDRLPYGTAIAITVAFVVSFIFPTLAALIALPVGCFTGFLFHRTGTNTSS